MGVSNQSRSHKSRIPVLPCVLALLGVLLVACPPEKRLPDPPLIPAPGEPGEPGEKPEARDTGGPPTGKKALAKKHFDKGYAHYERGQYVKAARELKLAYRHRRVPVVLYYIGKSLQAAGQFERAARFFRHFLKTARPNDPKRVDARSALRRANRGLR